jgi:hypothetical protein
MFKLTTTDGRSYGLRVGWFMNDVRREQFVYDMLSKLQMPVPRHQLLPPEISQKLKKSLGEDKESRWMSVTEWLPHPTGVEWLERPSAISKTLEKNMNTLLLVTAILGISDMHAANWVSDGTNVWPIDLAAPFHPIVKSDFPFWMFPNPTSLDVQLITEEEVYAMAKQADASVIKHLDSLTYEDMKILADKYSYKFNESEFEMIKQRLAFVLSP